ncbi:hypothetical protein JNUCC31_08355 [Paenibacillus sp. JNUCC31]|uniref:hypothetical protein n=1 Tax=Paenibacillus sp. JNUCC-31 TaxID=2777983 RepID=UPI00177E468B|nr:hypothetical protein [Paenibacillus sp. JNUCC-31]QOS80867.1 hypothetical protein JNUCC31_08355 [Paenibacillus sp. JNUCC-31]
MSRFEISKFYGKNEDTDKTQLWISAIIFLFSLGLFVISFTAEGNDFNQIFIKWACTYLSIFMFSVALFMSSFYYFGKKEGAKKYNFLRKSYFLVSMIIFIIAFLPLTITFFILNKINMETMFRYSGLYAISLTISVFINSLLFVLLYFYLLVSFNDYINSITICTTFVFFMNYFIMRVSGKMYFYLKNVFGRRKWKLKKGIISSEIFDTLEYRDKTAKREFMSVIYVMNFAIIALGSMVAYFIKIENIYLNSIVNELKTAILYSFALYTAFDRLWDKWKKSLVDKKNADNNNNIKSAEEELQADHLQINS